MADERGANGGIWFAVAFAGLSILLGLLAGRPAYEGWLASQIDLDDRCSTAETGRCFTERAGYVESVATDRGSVTVRYDDGRAQATLHLAGDSLPESGSRIRLESWNDDVVSVYEHATERRYRTRDWPERGVFDYELVLLGAAWYLLIGLWILLVVCLRALHHSWSRR